MILIIINLLIDKHHAMLMLILNIKLPILRSPCPLENLWSRQFLHQVTINAQLADFIILRVGKDDKHTFRLVSKLQKTISGISLQEN
jgi:hypothetical protein